MSACDNETRPPVSVVLVSFNTCRLTRECLESLHQELRPDDQVVVVDNGSEDGSRAMISYEFGWVELVVAGENLGFGRANNLAFERCRHPFVLLLNTDTRVYPGALDEMAWVLVRGPGVGAVGCRLENVDGSLQRSCWSFPTPAGAWREAFMLNRLAVEGWPRDWHRWGHDCEADVDFVIGAAMMMRAEAFAEVGGFDDAFFLYAEEADLQKRMWRAGWLVRFTPMGRVMHVGGASGASMKDRQLVEFQRARRRYLLKHHGRAGFWIARAGDLTGNLLRLMGGGLAWLVKPSGREVLRARLGERVRITRYLMGFGPRGGVQPSSGLRCSVSVGEAAGAGGTAA